MEQHIINIIKQKETSSNSYIVYLDQEETEKSFILLSSRYNKGIKIEIYENLYPLPQILLLIGIFKIVTE